LPSVEAGSYAEIEFVGVSGGASRSATVRRQRSNNFGKFFPRFSARRRIPAHAFGLKQYFCGVEVSRTCHNEHTAAALGHSEILGVEDAPRDCARGSKHTTCVRPFSPCREKRHIFTGQLAQKASEGVGSVGQDTGHVFVQAPHGRLSVSGADSVCMVDEVCVNNGKVATGVVESFAFAGHRERLAWRSSDDTVSVDEYLLRPFGVPGHVTKVRNGRITVGENGTRELFYLGEADALPAKRLRRYRGGVDSRTERQEFHRSFGYFRRNTPPS
jgi:hypothetical protein